jgi:hypothetical protein
VPIRARPVANVIRCDDARVCPDQEIKLIHGKMDYGRKLFTLAKINVKLEYK